MIDYLLLDVFTDRPYSGNPLAVVIGGGELAETTMRAVANELNLSESVFVEAPEADGEPWPTRIFTPQVELPFAGHPSVGAAVALAVTGRLTLQEGRGSCTLDEAVGPVPVEVSCPPGAVPSALLTTPSPSVRLAVVDRTQAARLLGVDGRALHPDLPPSTWSAGVAFTIVPVRDLDVLGSVRPSAEAEHVYAVCPADDGATEWRARMFAPAMGIAEDPATGAAAAAFAGYLAALAAGEHASPTHRWTIRQGIEMGRPSRIDVEVDRGADGAVAATRIGGSALIVGSGSLADPNDEILVP